MSRESKVILLCVALVFIFIAIITLLNRCADDENDNQISQSITDTAQSVEEHSTVDLDISETERIDSLLRCNIEHDTTSMYELPSSKINKPQEVYYRFAYTVSYNPSTRCANWVAWSLKRENTNGEFTRNKLNPPYYEDVDSLTNKQHLIDWRNEYPYEHGHMCPAADNRWNEAAMRQSFFLSNMCPQYGDLNQGDWLNLEEKCRFWADKFGTIYIVAGPIFESSTYKFLPESSVAIPDKFFKVILCMTPKPMAIGFIYPNDNSKHRFFEAAKSIDYVEKITGIDFFYQIDDITENEIESSYNLKDWHIREK